MREGDNDVCSASEGVKHGLLENKLPWQRERDYFSPRISPYPNVKAPAGRNSTVWSLGYLLCAKVT
jgi:hypothetical protein